MSRLTRFFRTSGPFLGLLLVCGLFALTEEREFIFTGGNFKNILTQTVIVAVGALGMTLIIVGGGIDLSVGSVVAFTSVLGARLLVAGWSPMGTLLALVGVGAGIGLFNGTIVAGLRMMPFIVTLGMMGVVRGAAKWLGDNQTINAPPDSPVHRLMARVSPSEFWPLPWGVWIVLGLAVVMALILRQTVFGRYAFAIGANETAARYSGVRVGLVKGGTYALAGTLFGLAGLLQLARLTQGDPTVAVGLELDIIAAVVIGGASLNGGVGSIGGSLIGALIMALLRNGTNQLGWQTYTQEIIIGVVIVLAVGLDKWRQSRHAR
jgi:ribose transport system permease protein